MSSSIGKKVISTFKRQQWRVNPTAVGQACEILGIKHGAEVVINKGAEDFWWGTYDVFPLHTISLNSTTPIREVSVTIWHELAHAMQCERDFDSDGIAFIQMVQEVYQYSIDPGGCPVWDSDQEDYDEWFRRYYRTIPMEQEAESIAQRYAKRYPLIS